MVHPRNTNGCARYATGLVFVFLPSPVAVVIRISSTAPHGAAITNGVHRVMNTSSGKHSEQEVDAFKIDQKFGKRLGAPAPSKAEQDATSLRKRLRSEVTTLVREAADDVIGKEAQPRVSQGTGRDAVKQAKRMRKVHRRGKQLTGAALVKGRY